MTANETQRTPQRSEALGLSVCVAEVNGQPFSRCLNLRDNSSYPNSQWQSVECKHDAATRAFSLPRRRGEGGRRPDEGWGRQRRRTQPLTPTLSPPPRKGEGASARRGRPAIPPNPIPKWDQALCVRPASAVQEQPLAQRRASSSLPFSNRPYCSTARDRPSVAERSRFRV